MTVIGPDDMVTALSRNLNPRLLVELVSDLLAVEGHTGIKIMDGPGDGCRDIHSIDNHGNKTLSQCKFHQDASKTVSSKEMGELPMGMIKLDYKKGIFITNVEISPQAKREYLDSYNNLDLDYLDGRELVARILRDSVLKALWFDGEKISRVSTALIVPVIARDLTNDRPFPVVDESSLAKIASVEEQLYVNFPGLHVNVKYDVLTPQAYYSPYRAPNVTTTREGVVFDIKGTEFIISGVLPLNNIDQLLDTLASEIVDFIENNHNISRRSFGIRIGTPSLAPLQGSSAGARLEYPSKPFTLLRIDKETYEERSWLKPKEDSAWRFPRIIRASQYNQTRLHNANIDSCVEYGLISPPGNRTRHSIAEERRSFAWYWERSLFVLLPINSAKHQPQVPLPEADYAFEWVEGKEFRGWLYGTLSRGFHISSTATEDEDISYNYDEFRYSEKSESNLKELRRVIRLIGGEIVNPHRARYIVAAFTRDPFPSADEVFYGTAELVKDPDDIPSPIDLSGRRLVMTICWNLGIKAQELDQNSDHQIVRLVEEALARELQYIEGYVEADRQTFSKDIYVILHIEEPSDYNPICHIDQRLMRFGDLLNPVLQRVENTVQLSFPKARRATEEYWKSEYDIRF